MQLPGLHVWPHEQTTTKYNIYRIIYLLLLYMNMNLKQQIYEIKIIILVWDLE